MVIVMPTCSSLRDGFAMVDEVFALSPISARAAQPNEADYEAIRDAFMETSRGRWFLGEYAKRNRNADTSMVLDAVARIEHALAAQRQQQQEFEQADSKALPEALAAIRAAFEDAALGAASALDRLSLEQNLAPVRKGTRIIKEISWRWREIGADSRICDLIDSQVISIEAACDQLASADPKAALMAAFEIIKARLDQLDASDATPPAPDQVRPTDEEATPAAQAAAAAEVAEAPALPAEGAPAAAELPEPAPNAHAAATPLLEAVAAIELAEAAFVPTAAVVTGSSDTPASPTIAEAAPLEPATVLADTEAAVAIVADDVVTEDAEDEASADAQDQAILELVAAEMGAPDAIDDEEFRRARTLGFDIEEPSSVDDDIVASYSEPVPAEPEVAPRAAEVPVARTVVQPAPSSAALPAMPSTPVPVPAKVSVANESLAAVAAALAFERPTPSPQVEAVLSREQQAPAAVAGSSAQAMPRPSYEPSLGSTLLANGLLQRPRAPANDPLTPIRRMTQPEKIAFFS